jgi:plasmid stabilization system protein ParE
VVGSYNIYYVIEAHVVEVVAILHSARDHERILFPED